MTGKHKVKIKRGKITYVLNLCRNITVIRGDSGTGKTTLVNLVDKYRNRNGKNGIEITCDKPCITLRGEFWKSNLDSIKDSIVFLDEGSKFMRTIEFARAVANSDNYYVLITRSALSTLPYSVHEIYELKTTGNILKGEKVYTENHSVYSANMINKQVRPELIITEDSNAGFDALKKVCSRKDIECIASNGKTKLKRFIVENEKRQALIIADGAAFGSDMRIMMDVLTGCQN